MKHKLRLTDRIIIYRGKAEITLESNKWGIWCGLVCCHFLPIWWTSNWWSVYSADFHFHLVQLLIESSPNTRLKISHQDLGNEIVNNERWEVMGWEASIIVQTEFIDEFTPGSRGCEIHSCRDQWLSLEHQAEQSHISHDITVVIVTYNPVIHSYCTCIHVINIRPWHHLIVAIVTDIVGGNSRSQGVLGRKCSQWQRRCGTSQWPRWIVCSINRIRRYYDSVALLVATMLSYRCWSAIGCVTLGCISFMP